jgi:S-(hydroxymethyl)glutathione dehydrogenase/alcohol dehydrogenase
VFGHYLSGALRLDDLVTRTYRLERAAEAMEDMMSGRNAKGVILFE